jgi:hypothetical protein
MYAKAVLVGMLAMMAQRVEAQDEPDLEFVFEETVTLGDSFEPGDTARGFRRVIPITGGYFEGPEIRGEVLPGGWDWQLQRADGCTEVKADYFLKTDDGVIINIVNTGVLCPPADGGTPPPVRTQPVFEPPLGKYEWLGTSSFVGTLAIAPPEAGRAVRIRIYRAR